MEQIDIEECIRMTQSHTDDWFYRRKQAWDEHRAVCRRQGVTPLSWDVFKRLVMRLETFQEMVDCGVLNARGSEQSATIILFNHDQRQSNIC